MLPIYGEHQSLERMLKSEDLTTLEFHSKSVCALSAYRRFYNVKLFIIYYFLYSDYGDDARTRGKH